MISAMQETPSPTNISVDSPKTMNEVNPKLIRVLKKLLQPKFKLHNDDYLNLLLTHLTKQEDTPDSLTSKELEAIKQLLIVWLKGAVVQFERANVAPNIQILTFVLNVTKYLCENEQIFVKLNSEDVFERLVIIIKRVSHPNVTVALIKLLADFMNHKSGLQWIISTNHWQLLIDIILNNETLYVSKEGNRFIAKLLEKSFGSNIAFCKNVIQHVLTPLEDATRIMSENSSCHTDIRWLSSSYKMLNEVLIILLKHSWDQNEKAVLILFIEKYNLEKIVHDLLSLTQDPELKTDLIKFKIFLSLFDLRSRFEGLETVQVAETDNSLSLMFNGLYQAATEISVPCMLQLFNLELNIWFDIKANLPICIYKCEKVLTFEDQILALQMMPVMAVFIKTIGVKVYFDDDPEQEANNDFRFKFISKLTDRIYSKTTRIKYKWMRYLVDNFSFKNGILALKFLVNFKKFYNKENGILAFQSLVYLIQDLNVHLKNHPQAQIDFLNEPDYLALHLKVMDIVIDEFDVTWKDSVEAMLVLNQIYNLLNGFIWPSKIVVNALKLAEKAISKYMTYQMALLIDDSEDCLMNDFPPLLNAKLHDGAWEVRDSTVELIRQFAITAINTKFSSYKNAMLENDFPFAILRMANSDGSYFVRASALKCLQDIIKDEEFWNCIQSKCNIFDIILKILHIETEGVVRSQAATLVDRMYEYQKIPEDLITNFYDTMNHAVVADLHWEVRVNALKFWKRVIDDSLTQQGMIDGSFPSVTFSKQQKKIVTLNNIEVRKRLVSVLHELSQIGCLAVFYEAIKDECDFEVSKFAIKAIEDFVVLLKQYEVSVQSLQPNTPTTPIKNIEFPVINQDSLEMELNSPSQYKPFSDSIMDEILDTRDLNLLETIFNTLENPAMEHIDIKKCTVLCPIKFLDLVYSDLDSRINEKTKIIQGIDSFQSLLDDILREYEPTDVNSMDCY